MGEVIERERGENHVFYVEEHIYKLQISLSVLILLSKLSPMCGIVLSTLVSLREMSKGVTTAKTCKCGSQTYSTNLNTIQRLTSPRS